MYAAGLCAEQEASRMKLQILRPYAGQTSILEAHIYWPPLFFKRLATSKPQSPTSPTNWGLGADHLPLVAPWSKGEEALTPLREGFNRSGSLSLEP